MMMRRMIDKLVVCSANKEHSTGTTALSLFLSFRSLFCFILYVNFISAQPLLSGTGIGQFQVFCRQSNVLNSFLSFPQ